MMKEVKQKFTLKKITLYRPATCQIKMSRDFDEGGSEFAGLMTITLEREGERPSVITLTGTFDQAALHGVFSHIRDLNAPLASVQLVGSETDDGENCLRITQ
jgi:hypothetical protein